MANAKGVLPLISPMLAASSQPFDSDDYLFEVKWDGYRCLAYLDDNTILRSRNMLGLTGKFPELNGLHKKIKKTPAILDGEIVVMRDGRPAFAALQSRGRMSDIKVIGNASLERPAVFVSFDILYHDGKNIMGKPLSERKGILEEAVHFGQEIALSQAIYKEGRSFYDACVKEGLEGVVAKKLDSLYLPGKRTSLWKKIRHNREADLVVCGYQHGAAVRSLGSLVLGGYRNGVLVFHGKVGTGFSQREAEVLYNVLRKLEITGETLDAPREERKRTRWVRPVLVCAVEYLALTSEGHLRHPVYKGIRTDKDPEECQALRN